MVDLYESYFKVVLAETEEQRNAAFRLRYDVYCIEHPFEDPSVNPGSMERDAFDERALHAILIYRQDNAVIGTVRLLLPDGAENGAALPIRRVCSHPLIGRDNPVLPWVRTGEISRFAVSRRFRRREGDQGPIGEITGPDDGSRRIIPNTSLGLMQAMVAMTAKSRMSHVCAMMEPALLRMLRRLGLHFIPAGPEVDYHGRRQPCYSDIDLLLTRVWIERPEVWEVITAQGKLWPLNQLLADELRLGAISAGMS